MFGAVREYIEAIAIAVVVFFILQVSIQNFKVEGSSMEPTLANGEYLLVNKLAYLRLDMDRLSELIPFWESEKSETRFLFQTPHQGDVVVFHYPVDPDRDFVKRVVAVPGQTVEIRRGHIYVDGESLEAPYDYTGQAHDQMSVRMMGQDEYFVVGDNRRYSSDSRDWGPVPMDNIVGKAWLIYWPAPKLGFMENPDIGPSSP